MVYANIYHEISIEDYTVRKTAESPASRFPDPVPESVGTALRMLISPFPDDRTGKRDIQLIIRSFAINKE